MMGLSIHYSGKLRDKSLLPELIIEVKEIAEHYKWPCRMLEIELPETPFDEFDPKQPVFGIVVSPPDCETIYFSFLSNGIMCNPTWVEHCADNDENKNYMYSNHTKTQYAGVEVHQKVILLFRYITKKYFAEFDMLDESKYWETGDEQLMMLNFEKYNTLVNNLELAFRCIPPNDDENTLDYLNRVFKRTSQEFKERFGE